MPPATKRNVSVILYDVNTSGEFAEAAKTCLLNICALKWFMDSKDHAKLILVNTRETKNCIYANYGKCPHVYAATDFVGYDPNLLAPHLNNVEKAEADWLLAIAVALEELKEFVDTKGIITMQLLFITDFSTPTTGKEKQIAFAIENLNKLKVFLYILGPAVKVPYLMSTFEDIQQWMKNVEFVDNETENPNLAIAKRIVQNTNGIVCDLQLGEHLFSSYYNRWSLQPWKVPLTIGSSLTIPVSTSRFLRAVSGPRFKGEANNASTGPWQWHLVDDVLETVPYDKVIGGIFRHNVFVPLPADVEKNFKYDGSRCFKIIGFTDKRNVSEFYMRGNGSCYVESDGSKNFLLLVHVLAKQNKCAIVQRVYMSGCRPKLVALLPDAEKGIMILVDLPYSDSIRANFIEQDVDTTPAIDSSNPAVGAMYEYLQKLDITNPENNDEGSVKVPLCASLMNPIRLSLIAQRCLQKYFGNEVDLEPGDINLHEFIDESAYKQYFPVRQVAQQKKTTNSD